MTVKELKDILAQCPDDLEVEVDCSGWGESMQVTTAEEGGDTFFIMVKYY